MSKTGDDLRTELFEKGALAVRNITKPPVNVYVCPICKKPFSQIDLRNGELSIEHIPPKSVGFRSVLLICTKCNNEAGSRIDAHLARQSQAIEFAKGLFSGSPVENVAYGVVKGLGKDIKAHIRREGSVLEIHPNWTANDPTNIEKYRNTLEQMYIDDMWNGAEMSFSLEPGFDSWAAKVAELRIAYLAAFVLYGYSYIFGPGLDLVRKQIQEPDKKLIRGFSFHIQTLEEPTLIIAPSITPFASLVVQIHNTLIVLPNRPQDTKFYAELEKHRSSLSDYRFHSNSAREWPRKPVYMIDLPHSPEAVD